MDDDTQVDDTRLDDTQLDDDLVRGVGDELLRISRRRVVSPPGSTLDLSAFRILWLLVEHGPRTLSEIGDDLQLEQSTVSRQVSSAGKRGLVERVSRPDSPHQVVQATSAGREAYEVDGAVRSRRFRAALHAMGPERVRRLRSDLAAFNDAIDAADD